MALDLDQIENPLFKHSREYEQGSGKERKGTATFVVALDGSGDFSNIQEAINSLPTKGGEISIKEGTYLITTPIVINKNNVTLRGTGKSAKIQSNTDIRIITASGKSGLLIDNLYLYNQGAGSADEIIHFTTVTKSIITNCWIENAGVDGITLYLSSDNNKIDGNIITDVNNGILVENASSNNLITGNISTSNVFGITITGTNNTDKNTITGNTFSSNTNSGGNLNGSKNLYVGNAFSDNTAYGVYNQGDRNNYVGNILLGNGTANLTDAGTNTGDTGNIKA